MRVKVLLGVIAMVCLSVGVAAAIGHSEKRGADAKLTIEGTYRHGGDSEVGATGLIKTSEPCTPNRKVTMYKKKGGNLKKVGTGLTYTSGRWEAKTGKGSAVASGTYVAKIPDAIGRRGKKCDGDSSPPTKLP